MCNKCDNLRNIAAEQARKEKEESEQTDSE